jgi:hypothetical protein
MSVFGQNGEIPTTELPVGILGSDTMERHVAEHLPDEDDPAVAFDHRCYSTDIVVHGLVASAAQMDRICASLRHSTEHLREGNESHFRPLFVSALDELAMFLQFLVIGRSYVGGKGNALNQFHAQIKEQVEQMIQAYQRRDFALLTDLIEYEVTPLFEGWQGVRNALLKSLSPHACNA